MRHPVISVVIISLNEAGVIARAVESALLVGDEVIVVDGQSHDGSAEVARRAGARVLEVPRSRGRQLHAGALAARGSLLVFLHADAELGAGARQALERVLADPELAAGNFLLRFHPNDFWARLYGWANDLRRRWLRIYYGDSALFVRRETYFALGGFRSELPLMEDFEFLRRLERGARTVYVRDVIVTASARRFARRPLRTLGVWTAVQILYSLGVDPMKLARWYGKAAVGGARAS